MHGEMKVRYTEYHRQAGAQVGKHLVAPPSVDKRTIGSCLEKFQQHGIKGQLRIYYTHILLGYP